MTPKQEREYIAKTKEIVEASARHAIENFRLETSHEPNCIFVSPAMMQAGMHVGCRDDRPGTIHGHIDEKGVGRLHLFNLKAYPLEYLQGFSCLAAIIANPS